MFRRLFARAVRLFWLLPGFLLWASFPPMGEKTDCLFALAPLMWLARRAPAKRAARTWFANGLLFWIATLSWMPAIVKNGGPWPLVVLGWGALSAYCALYFGACGWLSARYWSWVRGETGVLGLEPCPRSYGWRMLGVLVVEPVLWCGLELVRSRLFGGFAWNHLGVPVVNAGFGAPAALGGVYLVSAVVILVNGTIAGIAERMWRPEKSGYVNLKRLGSLETFLVAGLVFALYRTAGACQESGGDGERSAAETLSVAMVQRDFPCVFDRGRREDPVAVYSNLLQNVAYVKPDLVVLPESALCEFGEIGRGGDLAFAAWASRLTGGASVLAGGSRTAEGRIYNSAALYDFGRADGRPSVYDKVHLVPFGEYIPGDKVFPVLQKLAPVGSCTAGEPRLLPLSAQTGAQAPRRFGVAICFEDTDSALMRTFARQGADLLVFITNDSWFSRSIEAEQHAWQSVARAIETGLAVVRVGNSGVTGTVTPRGKASWLAGPDARPAVDCRATMCDRVPLAAAGSRATPYVRLGDAPLFVMFALLITAMVLVKYKTNYEKRRSLSV